MTAWPPSLRTHKGTSRLDTSQVVAGVWKAFSDAHFEIAHLASDGDTVICIGTMSGTHEGTLLGVLPPAGRSGGALMSPSNQNTCGITVLHTGIFRPSYYEG